MSLMEKQMIVKQLNAKLKDLFLSNVDSIKKIASYDLLERAPSFQQAMERPPSDGSWSPHRTGFHWGATQTQCGHSIADPPENKLGWLRAETN